MEIKKFEKYTIDLDGGEIAEEYAKSIISKYIDEDFNHSLEDIFIETIKDDDLDEIQANFIKHEMISYLKYLLENAKRIRHIHEIDAEKYNL